MEPKDLKNSNDELNANPEATGDAATPVESQDSVKNVPEEEIAETNSQPEEPVSKEEASEEPVEEVVSETDSGDEVEQSEEEEDQEDESDSEDEEEEEMDEETANAVIASGKIDYSSYTEVELINALRDLLAETTDEDIKDEVDRIKINFFKKHRANVETEKAAYLADGGKEEDFEPGNAPYEDDLKNLLREYRQLRGDRAKEMEEEKEQNLEIKYQIIEDIKSLVNRDESINKTFQEFRDLQQKWRDTGLVPQAKLKDLWETYHHHVENFYDYIKINKELRDLDLKKNMEAKITICEKAEELLVEPSVIKAFNILQKYHEQWREIGPVPRDKKDDLWERFKAATSKINKKHQEYFEDRKEDQKHNLDAKTVLCEKAEEIATLDLHNHKDWDDKSKELIELQKVWRTIGFAPKKDNNRIYERFRGACDKFFDAKREFYAQNKEMQQNNLQLKLDLCVQAEALKDSTDWKKSTDEFISIQKKWKEIGPVPRKQSDAIWKRFRAACDYFFDQKSEHFNTVDHEQVDNLKLKQELIEEIRKYKLTKDEDEDLEQMKDFQRRWTEIGHVPFKDKDKIQNEFRNAINEHFDHLRIDEHKRNVLKFKTKISNFSETSKGQNKMRFERDKYITKMKQLENDLSLLNNNIGFFANTKNAESLIEDVNKKIQATIEKIELLKEKIRIIDEMDDED
ncbi:DUF349 domain-containing protein [Mangrovibacterium diazotrophicum]|uniref:Uncharacterized protein DUF349 n=1 Tax=Mangrovibacterium diazotrophicum TaxID=1261403 RepID=A0A419VWG5_9BACT|nr:DUF349 domain-containing protein [Mangrovibacterium diazotrophicum]RKD86493.1 uncharacterized protein DUF349 [Mangrovibacterium diazotrophicum]